MIGDLYNWVSDTIIGTIPIEFEFIIPIIVILVIVLMLYCVFFGFIFIKDMFGGR